MQIHKLFYSLVGTQASQTSQIWELLHKSERIISTSHGLWGYEGVKALSFQLSYIYTWWALFDCVIRTCENNLLRSKLSLDPQAEAEAEAGHPTVVVNKVYS